MKKRKVRPYFVYVWDGVLTSYSDGMMFAVAHCVEEARKLIRAQPTGDLVEPDLSKAPTIYKLSDKPARIQWGGD